MFLLILITRLEVNGCISPLHSNMFLLIRHPYQGNQLPHGPLHSNMFLLIPGYERMLITKDKALHSNMFLLIRFRQSLPRYRHPPLHSNMFLLIPRYPPNWNWYSHFTFQYVSINTQLWIYDSAVPENFTFQYVSINTKARNRVDKKQ